MINENSNELVLPTGSAQQVGEENPAIMMLVPVGQYTDEDFLLILNQYNQIISHIFFGEIAPELQKIFSHQLCQSLAYLCSKSQFFYPDWIRINIVSMHKADRVLTTTLEEHGYLASYKNILASIKIVDQTGFSQRLEDARKFTVKLIALPGDSYVADAQNRHRRVQAVDYYKKIFTELLADNNSMFSLNKRYSEYHKKLSKFYDDLEREEGSLESSLEEIRSARDTSSDDAEIWHVIERLASQLLKNKQERQQDTESLAGFHDLFKMLEQQSGSQNAIQLTDDGLNRQGQHRGSAPPAQSQYRASLTQETSTSETSDSIARVAHTSCQTQPRPPTVGEVVDRASKKSRHSELERQLHQRRETLQKQPAPNPQEDDDATINLDDWDDESLNTEQSQQGQNP